jgi:hypothetical protein
MKKLTTILAAMAACICGNWAHAQQNDADTKAMMAYMTPGATHAQMAKSAGNWSGAITYWMQPGAAPTNTTGEAKNEMILGGRYLKSTNTGNMMGMPFEGMGITGYDNAKKVFVSTWVDNMGTGIMYMEGTWDDNNKAINFSGKMVDPVSGKDLQLREVLKFIDDNNQVMEMYISANGQEFKTMEIKYTRKP